MANEPVRLLRKFLFIGGPSIKKGPDV